MTATRKPSSPILSGPSPTTTAKPPSVSTTPPPNPASSNYQLPPPRRSSIGFSLCSWGCIFLPCHPDRSSGAFCRCESEGPQQDLNLTNAYLCRARPPRRSLKSSAPSTSPSETTKSPPKQSRIPPQQSKRKLPWPATQPAAPKNKPTESPATNTQKNSPPLVSLYLPPH